MTTVYPTSTHGAHGNSGDKSAGKHLFSSGKGRKCLETSGDQYSQFLWELDGIWMSIIVAEFMAVAVTAVFLAAKRKKHGY